MQLCTSFEDTFKNATSVTLHLLVQAFENTQWRKVKQIQPMQLCSKFEDTLKNATSVTLHPFMLIS